MSGASLSTVCEVGVGLAQPGKGPSDSEPVGIAASVAPERPADRARGLAAHAPLTAAASRAKPGAMNDAIAPVAGFRFAGVHAGIKTQGALDLGLLVAEGTVPAAGVFTRNRVRAAPVVLTEQRLRAHGTLRAVVVNSGNANACTGDRGMQDARAMSEAVAQALGEAPAQVAVASTGVIGVPLPADRIAEAVPTLVSSAAPSGSLDFARAILTTDRGPKFAQTRWGDRGYRLVAVAKGAGMIHPDMATTLAFVATDAPVDSRWLQEALRAATDETFNAITVDGDTSTNDCILAMASGAAGGPTIASGAAGEAFQAALGEVLGDVAQMIVADGEGAQHVAEIVVTGAPSATAARYVARTVATSQLVKTAMHGCDPNWGRILAAAGRAGVAFDPNEATVRIGDVVVFAGGRGVMDEAAEAAASRIMREERYTVGVDLGCGEGRARYWTCDLGHEYVRINADYRS